MITAVIWILVFVIVVAGLAALGRNRSMTEEEYESRRGKGTGIGNALLKLQDFMEPQRAQAGKARQEQLEEADVQGDPPTSGDPGRKDLGPG